MNKSLAIVIPAYKIDYFKATLDSLSVQTRKDFTVYIGDDCSPSDFKQLIDDYQICLDIVYYRFETNMGGRDLVGQWKRCIELTNNEPWIWLFSDDDVIGPNCVDLFYKEIENNSVICDLYHFDVKVIDTAGDVIRATKLFPSSISSKAFYQKKSSAQLDSFVVEYIFSRAIYNKVNGFQNFEMAWGSDIATWIKMGAEKGIKTLNGDFVYWRQSNSNITPNLRKDIVFRKLNIDIDFLVWVKLFFKERSIRRYNQYILFRLLFFYSLILDRNQVKLILKKALVATVLSNSIYVIIKQMYPIMPTLKLLKLRIYDNKK